ncbi:hypothetical protein N7G274_010139 [Stereocaulon virgatum]|uniref:Uncharacterized protein n=1 Tax=Stereocaulon virgatum TaxID=373712 RepID=A0ABR3ZWL9_9LECA
MVRDVAIPLKAHLLAELFSLNVKTSTNKSAAHSCAELYKLLIQIRNWVDYPSSDPITLASIVQVVPTYWSLASVFNWSAGTTDENHKPNVLKDLGLKITKGLQTDSHDQEIVAQMAWMRAVSGVGRPVTAATEVLHYFLSDEGERH